MLKRLREIATGDDAFHLTIYMKNYGEQQGNFQDAALRYADEFGLAVELDGAKEMLIPWTAIEAIEIKYD